MLWETQTGMTSRWPARGMALPHPPAARSLLGDCGRSHIREFESAEARFTVDTTLCLDLRPSRAGGTGLGGRLEL